MSKIVCGFTGIGKTKLVGMGIACSVIEIDPTKFRWGVDKATCLNGLSQQESWPHNYCDHIERHVGTVDLILVSLHPEVVSELLRRGLDVTLVYPTKRLKDEYRKRYIRRKNPPKMVRLFTGFHDKWVDEARAQPDGRHIVLKSRMEYLATVLHRII